MKAMAQTSPAASRPCNDTRSSLPFLSALSPTQPVCSRAGHSQPLQPPFTAAQSRLLCLKMSQLQLNAFLAVTAPPAGPYFLLAGQDQVAEVPGVRREGRTPLGHSCGVSKCRVNIKIMFQRECCKWRWKSMSDKQGSLEELGAVSPGEWEVLVIIVEDNGIWGLLVHMHARANREQPSPNFSVDNLISVHTSSLLILSCPNISDSSSL